MRVLTGFFEKARGLLGTDADAEPVAIIGCSSVHTLGMRYGLDLAFVSRGGEVLRVCRDVGPGHVVSCPGARIVIERPASADPWVREGDRLSVAVTRIGAGGGKDAATALEVAAGHGLKR